MSRLGKEEVIEKLAKVSEVEKGIVKKLMDGLFSLVKTELKKDNEITFGNLLIFRSKLRKAGMVRNPKTGETKMAPEKKVVKIKIRKMLKNILEEGGDKKTNE